MSGRAAVQQQKRRQAGRRSDCRREGRCVIGGKRDREGKLTARARDTASTKMLRACLSLAPLSTGRRPSSVSCWTCWNQLQVLVCWNQLQVVVCWYQLQVSVCWYQLPVSAAFLISIDLHAYMHGRKAPSPKRPLQSADADANRNPKPQTLEILDDRPLGPASACNSLHCNCCSAP